jgi:hypothetical protein
MKNGTKNGLYEDLAQKIWDKDKSSREERIRWHTSGHHIPERSLTIVDILEDSVEFLDTEPRFINIQPEIWQANYMENPLMIAAMAKVMFENLKQFNRYSFNTEPNWISEARKYKLEVLNGGV